MIDNSLKISNISSVLFCCSENSIRSPMAEGILKKLFGYKIFVDSVGVRSAMGIDGFVVSVMNEIDIDLFEHEPKTFEDLEDSNFDLIISLSPEAQHHAVEMTRTMACELIFLPLLDPSIIEGTREVRLESYRKVRDQLMMKIKDLFSKFKD